MQLPSSDRFGLAPVMRKVSASALFLVVLWTVHPPFHPIYTFLFPDLIQMQTLMKTWISLMIQNQHGEERTTWGLGILGDSQVTM